MLKLRCCAFTSPANGERKQQKIAHREGKTDE
jgi:hypothetical protein